jgi:hypothetical protein
MKLGLTILILAFLYSTPLKSQTKNDVYDRLIKVNYRNIDTTNTVIKAALKVWRSYLMNCLYGAAVKSDTLGLKYWNEDEKKETTHPNYIFSMFPGLFYFQTTILAIEPIENDYFKILNCNAEVDSAGHPSVQAIYFVLVKKVKGVYKLFSYFYPDREKLTRRMVGRFNYYFPGYYQFSTEKAEQYVKFCDSLSALFDLSVRNRITYVIDTNNISLIGHFGCIYLGTYYTNKGGQYLKDQDLILDSFNECDEHELVHYFTVRKYPDKMQFFDEGLATWLGGSMGQNLSYHVRKLYDHFYRRNADTTHIMDLPRLDQETDPAYILGGVVLKYTAESFGINKALNLLTYSDKQYTPEEVIEKELGIPKDKLNSFLLERIRIYAGK